MHCQLPICIYSHTVLQDFACRVYKRTLYRVTVGFSIQPLNFTVATDGQLLNLIVAADGQNHIHF